MPSFLGHPRVNTVQLPAPVYATWNPAGTNPNITLFNGNLTAELTGSPPSTAFGTSATSGDSFDSGKRYVEIKIDNIAGSPSGIAFGFCDSDQGPGYEFGDLTYAYAFRGDGYKESNGIADQIGAAVSVGSVIQMAIRAYVDLGEAKANIWFGVDGTWFAGGDPAGDSNPAFSAAVAPLATDWAIRATMKANGDRITASFQPGSFFYPTPVGFTPGWGFI